jgi:hypothetical protein
MNRKEPLCGVQPLRNNARKKKQLINVFKTIIKESIPVLSNYILKKYEEQEIKVHIFLFISKRGAQVVSFIFQQPLS